VPYENRFPMPTLARDEPWYSFNYGFAHFTFMSSEHDYSIGTASLLLRGGGIRCGVIS
jgi:hypothetical protein